MIEGGGLGVFRPEDVGPIEVQAANGVVDIAVADEAEAVRVAQRYLSYFQGAVAAWSCADQRLLRRVVPENRLRVYDVRAVIDTLADSDTVLELRRDFGLGMVTALARVEGRPLGIVANNPDPSRRRDRQRRRRQGRALSCSSATPSTCRSCSCATPRESWSDPRPRRRRWCATARACSSSAPA